MTTNPQTDARVIRAPWTPEQVTALNDFQQRGGMHPFTCGADHPGPALTLIAREDGWHCWLPGCDYRQDWAHAFMAAVSVPAPAPTDEEILYAIEEALEGVLLPDPGFGVLEAARDAVLAAAGPLVDRLRRAAAVSGSGRVADETTPVGTSAVPANESAESVAPGRVADETQAPVDPIGISHELCPGFPDRCPNLRTVEPEPGVHLGGIRCGCADEQPAVVSQPDGEQRCPAKHGALGRICELPTGHDGMHTGSGSNGGAVWDGDAP